MPKNWCYHVVILFALGCVTACRSSDSESYYPTKHIDTAVYKQLNKMFNVTIHKAPDYLGGLTPNYAIALSAQRVYDDNRKRLIRDSDWISGFFNPSARKIIIKNGNNYVLINNKEELKKVYAPISTTEEALGYAILYTKSFAAFDDFFSKKSYRYEKEKPKPSYSIKKGNVYEVHLFNYQEFTCDHPYHSLLYHVKQDGSVKLISSERSFTNPEDDGLCVD